MSMMMMKLLLSFLTACFCFAPKADAFVQMRGSFLASANAQIAPPRSLCSRPFFGTRRCVRSGADTRDARLPPLHLSTAGPGTEELDDESTFAAVTVMSPVDEQAEAFKVVPPDCIDASDTDVVVKPGLGWGDGKHPSTYMCLQFVWEQVSAREKPSFLDYGTGSGVLAICAKKFGAGRVLGIDKDDEILEHAEDNCVLNSLDDISFLNGRELMPGSSGLYIGSDFSPTTFDVVCANMLPAALVKLASFISLGVKDDTGILGLSGIRHDQVEDVKEAFGKHGIKFEGERRREGASPGAKWTEYVLLIGRRPKMSEAQREAYTAFLAESAVE